MDNDTKYYLFDLGDAIVKYDNNLWYVRDKIHHKWIVDGSWMARYFDAQYDVIEIDYDEETETIKKRNAVNGFWFEGQEKMLNTQK